MFGPDTNRVKPPDVDVGTEAFTTLDSFRAHLDYLARLCLADRRSVVVATQAHVYEREDLSSLSDFKKTMRQTYMQTADGAVISAASLRPPNGTVLASWEARCGFVKGPQRAGTHFVCCQRAAASLTL